MRTMISQNTMRMLATVALIATAATVISCNKHLPEPEQPQGSAIKFTTEDNWTKAVADITTLQQEGFRVWAWFTGGTSGHIFYTDTNTDGTNVTYEEGSWTYEPERYWLNGTYDFFAIYPQELKNNVTYDSEGSKDFKVTYNVSSQKDLLVATESVTNNTAENPSPVELNFKHTLSQINFEARSKESDLGAMIYGIDFLNISSEGVYSSNEWEINQPNGNHEHDIPALDVPTDMYKTVATGIMMIPQDLTGVQIVVRYLNENTVKPSNPIALLTEQCKEWKTGYKYTYQFRVDANGNIQIAAPTVAKWESGQGGSFIVNTPSN